MGRERRRKGIETFGYKYRLHRRVCWTVLRHHGFQVGEGTSAKTLARIIGEPYAEALSIPTDIGDKMTVSQFGKIELKKAEEEHFHGDGSYVYFVGNKEYGFVKIGKSKRVEERFMELQVGCPFDLYLFGVYQNMGHYLEKHFHEKWRPYHVRGEWFRIEGNLEEFLHNCDAVPISALRYKFTPYSKTFETIPRFHAQWYHAGVCRSMSIASYAN